MTYIIHWNIKDYWIILHSLVTESYSFTMRLILDHYTLWINFIQKWIYYKTLYTTENCFIIIYNLLVLTSGLKGVRWKDRRTPCLYPPPRVYTQCTHTHTLTYSGDGNIHVTVLCRFPPLAFACLHMGMCMHTSQHTCTDIYTAHKITIMCSSLWIPCNTQHSVSELYVLVTF